MKELFNFPDEVFLTIASHATVGAIAALSLTARRPNTLLQDEAFWLGRIRRDLTQQPRLRLGQSAKNFFEVVYDFKRLDPMNYCSDRLIDCNNYKSYLTKKISPPGQSESDAVADHSLDAYLVSACLVGAEIWAAELIKRGANVNLNHYAESPLMLAASRGHYAMLELLITQGGDVNFVSRDLLDDTSTVLHAALKASDQLKTFVILTRVIFDMKKPVSVFTKLHAWLILKRSKNFANDLVGYRGINQPDLGGLTLVGWAIILNRLACFEALMKAGGLPEEAASSRHVEDMDYGFHGDGHALALAVVWQRPRFLQLLLPRYSHVDLRLRSPEHDREFVPLSLLEIAVKRNYFEGVVILLPYSQPQDIEKALVIAAENGHFEMLKILAAASPRVNFRCEYRKREDKSVEVVEKTPVSVAAKQGAVDCVRLLLARRADPNAITSAVETCYRRGADEFDPSARVDRETCSPLINAVNHLLSLRSVRGVEYTNDFSKRIVTESSLSFFQDVRYLSNLELNDSRRLREFGHEHYRPESESSALSQQALACLESLLAAGAVVGYLDAGGKSAVDFLINGLSKLTDTFNKNFNRLIVAALERLATYGATLAHDQFSRVIKSGAVSMALIKKVEETAAVDWLKIDADGYSLSQVVLQQNNAEITSYLGSKLPDADLVTNTIAL